MALPPQKFREIVFQILFSRDFDPDEGGEIVPFLMNELKVTRRAMLDAEGKANLILNRLPEIDGKIGPASTEYTFERISRVEKSILRLGTYEILHDSTIPPKVAIAEAIRLCRKFGTPESANFVNAILDTIYRESEIPAGTLA
ncbi:MAG: transcription antitermination factor NusB [Verrucomicrobia bacterium]|nr:transcription antitermination factor NusB [Verrucomicrobiota bacterium]